MIAHLSYVLCEGAGYACPPGQPADDAREARRLALLAGWIRKDGRDLCPNCKKREAAA